jgi:nitrite reductase/ring-hydroxylating ferredoxin subunit
MTSTISIATTSPTGGSAYHHRPGRPDPTISGVDRGTPAGEWLRRYWHPIALSAKVTDRPQQVRVLGEDLVLFRDKAGRAGLLYPRCMHRGTSLYYGRVEEEGIRCCYHGWLFSVEGTCLDQPCEPEGGLRRDSVRQPWYPVEERYGLVFAYLGPPEKRPVLPRYDILENLQEGEFIEVDDSGFVAYGDPGADPSVPFHWLQNWENIVDPYHVYVLHANFSGLQFAADFKLMPRVAFEKIDDGVIYRAWRDLPDGRLLERINSALLPNVSAIPMLDLAAGRAQQIGWHVAMDETHFRGFFAVRTRKAGNFAPLKMHNGKAWSELTERERRDHPGDVEAQGGQGRITLHSEEHLATSDRGIGLLRRMLRQQIALVAEGGDPAGVQFDEKNALVQIVSGNFYTTSAEPVVG